MNRSTKENKHYRQQIRLRRARSANDEAKHTVCRYWGGMLLLHPLFAIQL
ncbi:MAG: hypothetical protein WKG06_04890 [Segetibacter sp.]